MLGKVLVGGLLLTRLAAIGPADERLPDAAMEGDREQVRALLEGGADVDAAQGDGMTALHWAAYNDDQEMLKMLLKAGADVGATTRLGNTTPLLLACRNGNPATVKALLEAGADAGTANSNGTTALMTAASAGNPQAVEVLLDHGSDVNATESARGQTALMFAAALDRAAVIRLLAQRGADLEAATPARETLKIRFDPDGHIFYVWPSEGGEQSSQEPSEAASRAEAAAKADLEMLGRSLGFSSAGFSLGKPRPPLLTPPMPVGPQFVGGMTALLYAAREGHFQAVRALLESGSDINRVSAEKTSPLVMAIINGHLDLAEMLLEAGADPNLANLFGLTALWAVIDVQWAPHAAYPQPSTEQEKTGYLELMKALLKAGADPNAAIAAKPWFRSLFSDPTWVNPAGATPFWRAAQSSDIDAMRLLAKYGADPQIATKAGDTPLMAASGVGWASNWSVNAPVPAIEAVKYCVELGNDVNAVDSQGYTPLHGTGYIGNNDMVRYLVDHGAKVDVRSKAGDTPADMANGPWRFGLPQPETLALLESLGSPNSHNCRSDKCVVAAPPLPPAVQAQKDALDRLARLMGFKSAVFLLDGPGGYGGQE